MTTFQTPCPVRHSVVAEDFIADQILSNYALTEPLDCKLLSRSFSDIYLVTCPDHRYILRILQTASKSLDALRYELALLRHSHENGATVAVPIADQQGNWFTAFPAPEGIRFVTLFTYALGQPTRPDEQHVYAYGQSAASFHLATQDFAPQYSPNPLNIAQLIDKPLTLLNPFFADQPTQWAYLEKLAQKLRHHINTLTEQGLTFGACHNDLHGANAHIDDQNRVTFFDFDECAPGYYAYELAVIRWSEKTNTQLTTLFPAYLRGYTERRSIKDIDLAAIPLFVAARHLWWLAGQIKLAPVTGHGRLYAPGFFARAVDFLSDWERAELTRLE